MSPAQLTARWCVWVTAGCTAVIVAFGGPQGSWGRWLVVPAALLGLAAGALGATAAAAEGDFNRAFGARVPHLLGRLRAQAGGAAWAAARLAARRRAARAGVPARDLEAFENMPREELILQAALWHRGCLQEQRRSALREGRLSLACARLMDMLHGSGTPVPDDLVAMVMGDEDKK